MEIKMNLESLLESLAQCQDINAYRILSTTIIAQLSASLLSTENERRILEGQVSMYKRQSSLNDQ